jgi:hypothetical protein
MDLFHLKYIMAIRYILLPFGNLVVIWYIFPRLGILCQEQTGNPGPASHSNLFSNALFAAKTGFWQKTVNDFCAH